MVGPFSAIQSVILNYFRLDGRACRSEYWWWSLLQLAAFPVLFYIDFKPFSGSSEAELKMLFDLGLITPWGWLGFWFALASLVPNVTVTVRRLHDAGLSGRWGLICPVPVIGPLALLVFLTRPSEPRENRWGPPPGGINRVFQDDFARAIQSYAVPGETRPPQAAENQKAQWRETGGY